MTEAMSQNAYAKRCGVSVSYINQLVKAGSIPLLAGKVDVAAADEFMASRPRTEQPAKAKKSKGKLDGAHERARLAKEKADAQAIENAKARGELIDVKTVAAAWEKRMANFRAKVLQRSSRVAPLLAAMDDPKEVAGALKASDYENLEELANGDEPFMEGIPDFLS